MLKVMPKMDPLVRLGARRRTNFSGSLGTALEGADGGWPAAAAVCSLSFGKGLVLEHSCRSLGKVMLSTISVQISVAGVGQGQPQS